MVMPASVPPLAARMTAARRSVRLPAVFDTAGSLSHSARSRAKPSGVAERGHGAGKLAVIASACCQPRQDGRRMSEQMR